MTRTTNYSVSKTSIDLTFFWERYGYIKGKKNLIKQKSKTSLKLIPISEESTLTISKFRIGDSVVALRRKFGSLASEATHIIINNNIIIKINRNDKRVELTKYGLIPHTEILVQLAKKKRVKENIIEDEVPITTLIYSAFVKGEYPPKTKGKIERRLNVDGEVQVTIGIKAPINETPNKFWDMVFKHLQNEVMEKLKQKVADEKEFERDDLDFFEWNFEKGSFPSSIEDLR